MEDIDKERNVFGAYAVAFVKKQRRKAGRKFDTVTKLSLWVGRDATVSGGHKVVPIWWNTKKKCWELEKAITVTQVKVDNTVFPLRKAPRKGDSARKFEHFVDQFDMEAEEHDVYVVDKIVCKHMVNGDAEYLVTELQKYRQYMGTCRAGESSPAK